MHLKLFLTLLLASLIPAAFSAADQEMVPAICTFIPPLEYPASMPDRSLSGEVLILVHLDEKGELIRSEVLRSDLPPLFIVEARRTAQASRFLPARRDGRAVPGSITLPFRFRALEPRAEPAETQSEPDSVAAPPEPSAAPEDEPAPSARRDEVPPGVVVTEQAASGEASSNSSLKILEAGFGLEAVQSGPVKPAERFREGDRVYFWTRIAGGGDGDEQQILHVWSLGERTVQIIELPLRGGSWSTWSYKTLYEGMAGTWTVEVWDENGTLLGARHFDCLPAEADSTERGEP